MDNGNTAPNGGRPAKAVALSAAILAGLAGVSAGASIGTGAGLGGTAPPASTQGVATAPRDFPAEDSCPLEGDSRGDPALNVLKNRYIAPATSDMDASIATPGDMVALAMPHELESVKLRSDWPEDPEVRAVTAREAKAVTVEGYLVRAKEENTGSGESCNCHEPKVLFDYHLYLADQPGVGIADAVVVEMTPRWRELYPTWGTAENGYEGFATIQSHVDERVRVTGWMLFDEEHLNQVGKYRATVWEIHPITAFEYQDSKTGSWTNL